MAEIVFFMCAAMSLLCFITLVRSYKRNRSQLLFWSSICFALLAMNNLFLAVDLLVFPQLDMNGPLWRNLLSAMAGSVMLFGLIWELS